MRRCPGGGRDHEAELDLGIAAQGVLRGQLVDLSSTVSEMREPVSSTGSASGGAIARHSAAVGAPRGKNAIRRNAVGLDGQGVAGDHDGRRPPAGGVGGAQRRAHPVQVAPCQAEHHGCSGVVLARVGAVAFADGEGVDGEDGQRTGHGDHRDHRARLPAPSHLEQGQAGDEAAPAQQPAPRRARGRGGEVGQQQPDEQCQERGPGEGEGPAEASGDEGEDTGPHGGDQEGVERTERPPP